MSRLRHVDGTNENLVNGATHLRDRERAPVTAVLERISVRKHELAKPRSGCRRGRSKPSGANPPGSLAHVGKTAQGEKFSCTPWAHSVFHLRPTAGAGSQQRLADLLHTSSPVTPARGSCFLPLEAGGTNFRPALLVCIHLCEVVSCPLSWSKTSGSTTTRWVGFELLLREHAVGLTERRATWVVKSRQRSNSSWSRTHACFRGGTWACT